MIISNDHTIASIQKEFSTLFPQLQLLFFKTDHKAYEVSPKEDQLPEDTVIGDISTSARVQDFIIDPSLTVKELEEKFENIFGLHVQVLRKSKDVWLQTSVTDDWSLEKHNSRSLSLEKPAKELYNKL